MTQPRPATVLLQQTAAGDPAAAAQLLPLVYDELRVLAERYFRGQPADHALQPTALVHEAFMKLVDQKSSDWKSRSHFIAVAATAMRQILVDHARARAARKHGGGRRRMPLTDVAITEDRDQHLDLLALNDALSALNQLDSRQARVVELRFFGGMSAQDAADFLGVSKTTVDSDWRAARAWLNARLRDGFDP